MTPADYHPMRTQLIRRDLIATPQLERLAYFRANAAMKRLDEFDDLHGLLESDGRPIIDISTDAAMLVDDFGFSTGGQIDKAFRGTVFIHFGELAIDCLDGGLWPTGAYVSAAKSGVGGIEGKVIIVTTEHEWISVGVRPIQDILTEHADMRVYRYSYDRYGNYAGTADGTPGAFMTDEATEYLISILNYGVEVAIGMQPSHGSKTTAETTQADILGPRVTLPRLTDVLPARSRPAASEFKV